MVDALPRAEPAGTAAGAAGTDGIQVDAPHAPPPQRANAEAAPWGGGHAVNVRLSAPIPGFGRFYLTVVGGRERRGAARRAVERRRHPLLTYGNVAFLFVVGTLIGLALFALLQVAAVSILEQNGALVTP